MKQEEFGKIYKQITEKDSKLNKILNESQLYSELIKYATRRIVKKIMFSKPYYQMTATLRTYLIQSFALVTQLSIENAKDYLFTHSEKVLAKKAQEYAAPEDDEPDRLHNFKCAKRYFDINAGLFCINLMLKHIISITDILEGRVDADMVMIKEKWLDAYNYCILLESIEEDI